MFQVIVVVLAVRAYLEYLNAYVDNLKEVDTFVLYGQTFLVVYLGGIVLTKLFVEPTPSELDCVFFVLSRTLLFPKSAKAPADNSKLSEGEPASGAETKISNPIVRAGVNCYIYMSGSTAPRAEIASVVETVGTVSLTAVTLGAAFAAPRYARKVAANLKGRGIAQQNTDAKFSLGKVARKSIISHDSCKEGTLTAKGIEDVVSLLRVCSVYDAKSLRKQQDAGATPEMTADSAGVFLFGPQYGMEAFLKRAGFELTPEQTKRVVAQAAATTEEQNFVFARNFPGFFDKNGDMIFLTYSDEHGVSLVTSVQSGMDVGGSNKPDTIL